MNRNGYLASLVQYGVDRGLIGQWDRVWTNNT